MKQNMGMADRMIRVLIAALLTVLFFTRIIAGVAAYLPVVAISILLMTSLAGSCPVYSLFGMNTCQQKKHKQKS